MFFNKSKGEKYFNFLEEIKALEKEGVFFTDSHAHIHFGKTNEEIENFVKNAYEHNVKRILTIGIDYKDSLEAVKVASRFENVFSSVGVHPHDAKDFSYKKIGDFEKLLQNDKVLAVGEIGLDYFRNHSPQQVQHDVFAIFLDLAVSNDLPVIIHNRDATKDCISIMNSIDFRRNIPGIIHCFNGDRNMMKWALDKGFMISYAGPITYSKAEELRETVKYVPVENLLIETDSPYLSPLPFRGRQNEPKNVIFTANVIAKLKGLRLIELAVQLEKNFKNLTDI
jgi:TatD DNase family protein